LPKLILGFISSTHNSFAALLEFGGIDMICPKCGAANSSRAQFCAHCGKVLPIAPAPGPMPPPPFDPAQQKPPNYFLLALLATFGCLPIGGVILILSLRVDDALKKGNHEAAWRYSRLTKIWLIVVFVIILAIWGVAFINGFYRGFTQAMGQ
jgi:hypothetical protein